MPNLLKQFSIEDESPLESEATKKVKPDFLQQKYVTSLPSSPTQIAHPKHKDKKKVKPVESEHLRQATLLLILTSPFFSPKKYFVQLPTLFLGLMSYSAVYLILVNVQPAAIRNLVLPNTYLPLLLVAALGHFFVFWYLIQNLRRSLLIALYLSCLLFLRIHNLWNFNWLVLSTLPVLVAELLLTYRSFRR
ncbi:hypothetical protein BH10PAT2_BH10PAT2_3220 [soil metagenome]